MQIVVFDNLQFSLVFWSVPVIGNVILVLHVQINIQREGSFLFTCSGICRVSSVSLE